MKRIFLSILFLSVALGSLHSQEKMTYKIINSNQLIIDSDTLIINKTCITDILKQDEIEGMEPLICGYYHADDDSGNGYEYEVKRGACNLRFIGQKDDTYPLMAMRLNPSHNVCIYLNDTICFDNISEKILSDLDCYEIHKLSDSLFNYQKIGVWFKIYKSGSEIKLRSIRLHPKIVDEEIISYTYLKGKLYSKETDSQIKGMLLAYTITDTLRIFTNSYSIGKFYMPTSEVESLDIYCLCYESMRLDSLLNGKNKRDFYLEPKTYLAPELRIYKSGEIEIDSSFYLSQFPKVRDNHKIKYFDWDGGYLKTDPIVLKIGYPKIGFSNFYQTFVNQLDLKKYSRHSEANIWFRINEKGEVSLTKITGDDDLVNDHVAKAFTSLSDWSCFSMRGQVAPVNLKFKFFLK